MLLHRIKPKILNFNTAIQNLTKPVNNLAIVDYQKEDDYFDVDIKEIFMNNPDMLIKDDEYMEKSIVIPTTPGINDNWKSPGVPGIKSIVFYIDSSNNAVAIYKYSNAFAFLPISNNLIYAATVYITTSWTQGNIFSVTKNNIFNNSFFFDYSTTSILGQGVDPPNALSNKIYSIAKDASNNIYIGGTFYINDGTPNGIKGFAKWDIIQQKWVSLRGLNGIQFSILSGRAVYSIVVVDENQIYVGGYFDAIDENVPIASKASSFAKWNGINWETDLLTLTNAGGTFPANVYTMKRDGSFLYIGGYIDQAKAKFSATTINVYNIFRFNTVSYGISSLAGGTDGPVYAMDIAASIPNTPSKKCLYIGGSFVKVYQIKTTGGIQQNPFTVNNLARWNIEAQGTVYPVNKWTQIQYSTKADIGDRNFLNNTNGNRGVVDTVYAIAVNPRNRNIVWIGGDFGKKTKTKSRASDFIARFDITKNFTTSLWTSVQYGVPTPPVGLGSTIAATSTAV